MKLNLQWIPATLRHIQSRPRFGEEYVFNTYNILIRFIYKKLGVGFDIHVSKINKQGTQII